MGPMVQIQTMGAKRTDSVMISAAVVCANFEDPNLPKYKEPQNSLQDVSFETNSLVIVTKHAPHGCVETTKQITKQSFSENSSVNISARMFWICVPGIRR